MPVMRPDGLGLADTRSAIYTVKKVVPYAKTSASTTQYYKYPKKVAVKPKKKVAPRSYIPVGGYGGTGGGGGGGSGSLSLGAGGSGGFPAPIAGRSNKDLQRLAREAVALELDPQIHALENSYNQENKDYGRLVNELRKQLGLTTGDVKQLYAALDVNLKANLQKQKEALTTAKTNVGSAFDQLQTMLGSNYGNAKSTTEAELSRLGIQGSNATERLTSDQQFLQGTAATDKTNAQSILDQLNASGQSLGNLLQGSAASSGTVMQSQLQQGFEKTKGEADVAHGKALTDLKFQIGQLGAGRAGKISQTYQALLDQEYQRQQDAAQGAFDNNYKLAELGIKQQSLSTDTAYKQNSLVLQAKRDQAALAKQQAAANAPGSGLEKAMNYLQTSFKSGAIPASELQRALIDIINGDTNTGGGRNLAGFDARNLSEYAKDASSYVSQHGYPSQVYNALVNAMHYYFGK
jgi:hypothetical protein